MPLLSSTAGHACVIYPSCSFSHPLISEPALPISFSLGYSGVVFYHVISKVAQSPELPSGRRWMGIIFWNTICDLLWKMISAAGRLNVKNEELEDMVKEAPGPINFTVFLTMFGEKLKGKYLWGIGEVSVKDPRRWNISALCKLQECLHRTMLRGKEGSPALQTEGRNERLRDGAEDNSKVWFSSWEEWVGVQKVMTPQQPGAQYKGVIHPQKAPGLNSCSCSSHSTPRVMLTLTSVSWFQVFLKNPSFLHSFVTLSQMRASLIFSIHCKSLAQPQCHLRSTVILPLGEDFTE